MKNNSPSSVKFRASIALMEDYRLGTEITPQTQITQVVNASGQGELFYTGANATRQTVIYNVFPDRASGTGWNVSAIVPDFIPGQLEGGVYQGLLTLFCVGPDTSNPDLHFIQRDGSGKWGVWKTIDHSSVYDELTPPCYVRAIATGLVAGKLELSAVLADSMGRLSLWQVAWGETTAKWRRLGPVDSPFLDFCSTRQWGEGVLAAQANETDPTAMDLLFFPFQDAGPVVLCGRQHFRYADSAYVTPPGEPIRYSGIFLYNDGLTGGTRGVSYLDGGATTPHPVVIDNTLWCEQIVAVDAGSNPISFMAVDHHMRLNVISREDAYGAWNRVIELGDTLSAITAGLGANGAPLVFVVDAQSSSLYSMLKQPMKEGGKWNKQSIKAQLQTIEKLPVYGTTLTLMDQDDNLLRNHPILVTSPETTTISWQGQSIVIGERAAPASLSTDGAGQLTLYAPTGSINANKLAFSLPGRMANGDAIVIDADVQVQDRLKKLSLTDTQALLPEAFKRDAAAVQQAINCAMSYEPKLRSSGGAGARLVTASSSNAGFHRPLDADSGAVHHWSFSVLDGRASFTELSESEAAALGKRLLGDAGAKPSNLNGFFDFLGDIVNAVSHGVQAAFNFLVTTASGVVNAVIKCVINGYEYVYSGIVSTIERAFQIAESIFAAVRVFFERLFDFFGWLLSGARQDIWNTKKAFEGVINQSFPFLTDLSKQGKTSAIGFFANLKKDITDNFDAAIRAAGNYNFDYNALRLAPPSTALAGAPSGPPGFSPSDILEFIHDAEVKANWLLEKVFSPVGSLSVSPAIPDSFQNIFASFGSSLASRVGQEILDEITAVSSYLSSVATNPGNFMRTTVAAVLRAVKRLVLLVLDVLDSLTQAFLDLVIAFLGFAKANIFDKKIDAFLLEKLYNLINPEAAEDFTVTRLVALVCAFPTTIIYRLITGTSPFTAVTAANPQAAEPNAWTVAGGILTFTVWAAVDIGNDVGPGDRLSPAALYLAGTVPIVLLSILTPAGTPQTLLPETSDLNKSKNAFWYAKWLPASYTLTYMAANKFQAGPRGNPEACSFLTVSGIMVLAMGIAKGVDESKAGVGSGANWFLNLVPPLATTMKPLKFAGPYGLLALWVIDFMAAVGGGSFIILSGLGERTR